MPLCGRGYYLVVIVFRQNRVISPRAFLDKGAFPLPTHTRLTPTFPKPPLSPSYFFSSSSLFQHCHGRVFNPNLLRRHHKDHQHGYSNGYYSNGHYHDFDRNTGNGPATKGYS